MFERFTERARHVVVLAQDEARSLGHGYIGTEHLLLGLLGEGEGLAARVLDLFEITLDSARSEVEQIVGRRDEYTRGQIPFTAQAKEVLELALKEAQALKHNYLGTEHILLGLVRDNNGVAGRILVDSGADAGTIRDVTLRMLSERSFTPRPRQRPASARGAEAGRWEYEVNSLKASPTCGRTSSPHGAVTAGSC